MPRFMMTAKYIGDGLSGLRKDGAAAREKAIRAACEALGGRMECLYFVLGRDDLFAVMELPSAKEAAAFDVAVASSGLVSIHATALLTVAEMDEALALNPGYRPPGA